MPSVSPKIIGPRDKSDMVDKMDRKEQIQHYFASQMSEKNAQQGSDVVTHFPEQLRLKCRRKV